jgi:cytochrome P450
VKIDLFLTHSFSNLRVPAWKETAPKGPRPGQKGGPAYYLSVLISSYSFSHSHISAANDADHARMRRLLNHAFSEAALREQEPLMNSYFDLLIQKLYEKIDGPTNGKVNIVRWFNFTTFDLVGDLCFGEDFDALKTEEYVYLTTRLHVHPTRHVFRWSHLPNLRYQNLRKQC